MMLQYRKSAVLAVSLSLMVAACADVATKPADSGMSPARPALASAASVDQSGGTETTFDHVTACGQSIDLTGTVRYTFREVTDGQDGFHRVVDLQEDLSGIADPSGAVYSGSISIHETSELPGGDSDDSWPFTHTFHRQVRLTSPSGPDITVDRRYHATGTPGARIAVEISTRVERCG